jgi:signal peptidase
MAGPIDSLKQFFVAHPGVYQFIKDLAFSLAVVAIIALLLFLYAGVWTPVVSVNGTSMLDHMHAEERLISHFVERAAKCKHQD